MNREIKFRGKRLDNGEWLEGDLCTRLTPKGSMTICPAIQTTFGTIGTWFVRPNTVGQFIGLQDSNGKDIYEGDIIKSDLKSCSPSGESISILGVVEWRETHAEFVINSTSVGGCRYAATPFATKGEVIGNLYDNKELLNK